MSVSQEYLTWLQHSDSRDYKIILIEIMHNDGVVRLASEGYVDSDHNEFDDWLTDTPFISQSLGFSSDLGDIVAANPNLDEDWEKLEYYGFKTRMWAGDKRWKREQFQLIASANNEQCNLVAEREYMFDIIGDSEKYNRTFYTGEDTKQKRIVRDAVKWVMDQWELSGSYSFVNIPVNKLNRVLEFTVTESDTMQGILEAIARSVNIKIRMANNGFLEFVLPNFNAKPVIDLTSDNVVSSIETIDTIKAVKNVKVIYNNGEETTPPVPTGANTANISDTLEIESYLVRSDDAHNLAVELAIERSNNQKVYELEFVNLGDVTQPGEVVTINHSMLNGIGYVQKIQRELSFDISSIEVVV